MKTIIAGSRTILNIEYVNTATLHSGFQITEVVCGEAKGPDLLGRLWAELRGIPVRSAPAKWRVDGVYNPRAGFERNQEMADYADALIAVWDGESGGTKDMIARARKAKLQVFIYNVKKPATTNRLFDWAD